MPRAVACEREKKKESQNNHQVVQGQKPMCMPDDSGNCHWKGSNAQHL